MMPRKNGFDVLRELRASSTMPVLMLTARGEDVDSIIGLELGADDYLAKPSNPRVLVARIRAVLRRAEVRAAGRGDAGGPEILKYEDLQVHTGTRTVQCGNRTLDMTSTEYCVLEALLREAVDLSEMLHSVLADAAVEAQSRQCRLHLEHAEPVTVQGNAQLIHSAIENVVRNAVRYTPENTAVTLSLMSGVQSDPRAVISVRDCGPGVPENMLARLFEPFVRVGDARDRNSGGYGLGLAIAERAVRLHGGEISACNLAEGGFAVTIRLHA